MKAREDKKQWQQANVHSFNLLLVLTHKPYTRTASHLERALYLNVEYLPEGKNFNHRFGITKVRLVTAA